MCASVFDVLRRRSVGKNIPSMPPTETGSVSEILRCLSSGCYAMRVLVNER